MTKAPPGQLVSGSETESKSYFRLTPIAEIMKRPMETDWIIKGYLPADSTVMVFGASESGKSLIAMDMAYCIGLGFDYHSHPVRQGTVIYIAGEGQMGISKRFKALALNHQASPEGVHVSELPMDLLSKKSLEKVMGAIEQLPEITLVIIDTFNRNFTGEENSAKDIAIVMQCCDRIREATGASIMIVHHSGHNENRSRGSSALKAAMDVEYVVSKKGNLVTLKNTKAKDIEKPTDLQYALKSIVVGVSDEGKNITAPLLVQGNASKRSSELSQGSLMILEQLKQLLPSGEAAHDGFYDANGNSITINPSQRMVSRKAWQSASFDKIKVDDGSKSPDEAKRKRFSNYLKSLLNSGEVVQDSSKNFTIPTPTENGDSTVVNSPMAEPDSGHS